MVFNVHDKDGKRNVFTLRCLINGGGGGGGGVFIFFLN